MANKINSSLLAIIGILLFNGLFWEEKMGINVFIFTLFITGSLSALHPDCWEKKSVLISGAGTLLAAVLVVFVNSGMAKFTYWFSVFAFAGFAQQRQLKHIFYALGLSFVNLWISPYTLVKETFFSKEQLVLGEVKRASFGLRLFILPAIILALFYVVYYAANPDFASLSDHFWDRILGQLSWKFSFGHTLFIMLSVFLCGGLLVKAPIGYFLRKQMGQSYVLRRVRAVRQNILVNFSSLALTREHKSGIILLVSLNVLLLIVNITDVINVWLKPAPEGAHALMTYVHEGTYLLILAILMAMGIVLYFFRKNLNFVRDNEFLKHLSYLWLAQNALLAFSVGMRNYKYIEHCGLAYKRIGVILFLLLSLYGLFTLFVKVEKKRTFHFLVHQNAWALYFLLLFSSLFNWDGLITRYNIHQATAGNLDTYFLIKQVSTKNISILEANLDILKENNGSSYGGENWVEKSIQNKRYYFDRRQKNYNWRSWNLIDWLNKK